MESSKIQKQGARLWGGRFDGETDELVRALNDSFRFDGRLWREDIQGSIAHVTMLGEQDIIPEAEAQIIRNALEEIRQGIESGEMQFDSTSEDIHSAVETLLRDLIGPLAGKLHTARSRNDQVTTDTRLYLRSMIDEIDSCLQAFQYTLLEKANAELGEDGAAPTVLSGYTHLQHAQPVLLSHHLLAYFWMFQRDRERLKDCRKRANQLPLGACALAGTGFPISRERVADLLEFDGVMENSMDAVSDRDYSMEFLSCGALIGVHCSRLAEEVILWNSPEFGYVELDDSVTTGSSIMPQKKNPDVAELARGKSGRLIGNLIALITVMKGLPLAYNKDMQEDKEPLFDTIDTLLMLLPAFCRTLASAQFRRERMSQAMFRDFSTATDLADLLVRKDMPFRDAHHVVGRIVRYCIDAKIGLEDLSAETLLSFAPEFGEDAGQAATILSSVNSRISRGGSAPKAVQEQIMYARDAMNSVS